MIRAAFAAVLATGLATAASAPSPPPACFADGDTVTLRGTLRFESHYGPPNYGENPESDRIEVQPFLRLRKPVCLAVDDFAPELDPRTPQVEVMLVPLRHLDLHPFDGKEIDVLGRAWRATTGHDRRPIIVQVEEATAVAPRWQQTSREPGAAPTRAPAHAPP